VVRGNLHRHTVRLEEASNMEGSDVIKKISDPKPPSDSGKLMQPDAKDNLLDDVNPVDPPEWLVGPGCPH